MLYRFVVVIAVQLLLIFDVLNNRVEIMDGKEIRCKQWFYFTVNQKTSVHIVFCVFSSTTGRVFTVSMCFYSLLAELFYRPW